MLYTDSFAFKQICEAAEQASFDQGICIDLSIIKACVNERIIQREELTGDTFVTHKDLQEVVSIYADFNISNY